MYAAVVHRVCSRKLTRGRIQESGTPLTRSVNKCACLRGSPVCHCLTRRVKQCELPRTFRPSGALLECGRAESIGLQQALHRPHSREWHTLDAQRQAAPSRRTTYVSFVRSASCLQACSLVRSDLRTRLYLHAARRSSYPVPYVAYVRAEGCPKPPGSSVHRIRPTQAACGFAVPPATSRHPGG